MWNSFATEWTLRESLMLVGMFVSWLITLLAWFNRKRENRNDMLTEIFEPMIESVQNMNDANTARKTSDRLLRSFKPDVDTQTKMQLEFQKNKWDECATKASESYKKMERLMLSRSFRVSDYFVQLMDELRTIISALGDHMNSGNTSRFDLELARFSDHRSKMIRYARGVNWATPYKWLRKKSEEAFKKREAQQDELFGLDKKEMDEVADLIYRRLSTQEGQRFIVHPPQKLISNPVIAQDDDVIEQLQDSIFEIVFQDGHQAMISFPQLMIFAHQLIFLKHATKELSKGFDEHTVSAQVKTRICPEEIMKPEMVKALLSKIEFSESPSDSPEK